MKQYYIKQQFNLLFSFLLLVFSVTNAQGDFCATATTWGPYITILDNTIGATVNLDTDDSCDLTGSPLSSDEESFSLNMSMEECLDCGWDTKVVMDIDNSANPNVLTDYQLKITVNTQALISAGELLPDGADLRFSSATDSCDVYCHYIESGINTTTTEIWVKIPSLPANGITQMAMYYGNTTALQGSNPDCTFAIWEGFDDASTTFSEICGSPTIAITGGNLDISWISSGKMISDVVLPLSEVYIAEAEVLGATGDWPELGWTQETSHKTYGIVPRNGDARLTVTGGGFDYCSGSNWASPFFPYTSTAGLWSIMWRDTGDLIAEFPTVGTFASTDVTYSKNENLRLSVGGLSSGDGSMQVDWVRARKFSEIIPTYSFGVPIAVSDTDSPLMVCQNITVQLDASGNVSVLPSEVDNGSTDNCNFTLTLDTTDFTCANLGANNVTLTGTDAAGNTSSCMAVITVEDPLSSCNGAPNAVCQPIVVSADNNCQGTAIASDFDGGSTDPEGQPLGFSVAPAGPYGLGVTNVVLTVSDGSTSSTCSTTITVTDDTPPMITCPPQQNEAVAANCMFAIPDYTSLGVATDNCSVASITQSPVAGTVVGIGPTVVTLTATDGSGNTHSCTFTTEVADGTGPIADTGVLPDVTGECEVSSLTAPTATDNCDGSITGTTTATLPISASTTITWTYVDNNGNSSSQTQDIVINDTTAPVADLGTLSDVTGQCEVTSLTAPTATDNCDGSITGTTMATLPITASTTITWTYTDSNGNSSSQTQDIVLSDTTNPTAVCQDITIQLDVIGNASIIASAIDGGSTDNCEIASFSANMTTFDCSNVGANSVVLTVTDTSGNTATCSAIVTVQEATAPTVVCQDITRQLDASGTVTISGIDIDGGSTDVCGIASYSVTPDTFTCANVGTNLVTLTVTDIHGNSETCTATVTIEDVTSPVAVCQDITVVLDAMGNVTITGNDIDGGSTDACGIASLTATPNTFTIADIGPNNVTLTVTDVNGNTDMCTAIVTVEGSPTAVCQDITVQLDAAGNATIIPSAIDGGSTSPSGIAAITISEDTFDCSSVGPNTITLTITGNNGLTDSCTAVVTVEDSVAPIANCVAGLTVQLDASGNATLTAAQIDNGSTDACGIASSTIDISNFDCSNIGVNTVTLLVTDVNGNSDSCTTIVIVEDNIAPTALCQNIIVQLDATGNATITAGDIDGGSTDNCSIASTSININSFTCAEVGANNVTLTVTDSNGNSSSCVAVVTVEDSVAPSVVCQDVTVLLDASGNATITAADVNGGSDDACGVASIAIDTDTFTCVDIGPNNVILTVTDVNGNVNSCTAVVTVTDEILPVATCQDITVFLDVSGIATIIPADIDGGSTDNCSIASRTVSIDTFDCSNIGPNNVQLTVIDIAGNSAMCTAVVTVVDMVNPDAVCENITVPLDPDGTVTITPADVDGGSTDACGVNALSIDVDTFDCSNIGPNYVTLMVEDNYGNIDTCVAVVTITEALATPVAVCQNITIPIQLDGTATLLPEFLDGGSTGLGCAGIMSVDISEFDCSDIGTPVEVIFTVTNSTGTSDSCTAFVNVVDSLNPIIECPEDQTVASNGPYILPDYFANAMVTYDDNCAAVASTIQDPAPGTLLENGAHLIFTTVIDPSGNEVSCNFRLTVEDVLSVEDKLDVNTLAVYPNPMQDFIILSNPQYIPVQNVSLYDVAGRLVRQHPMDEITAETSIKVYDLASGTYLMLINTEAGQITKQVIKE